MELLAPILGAFLFNLTLVGACLALSAAIMGLFFGGAAIGRWWHRRTEVR